MAAKKAKSKKPKAQAGLFDRTVKVRAYERRAPTKKTKTKRKK